MNIDVGTVRFKLLLDTNAFIAVEPVSPDTEPGLVFGAQLARLAAENGHQFFVHAPATRQDISRDKNTARRTARLKLLEKYPSLQPISVGDELRNRIGEKTRSALPGSNDEVDLEMIAALDSNAVDYLVTDDRNLRKRAARAGLAEFVVPLASAVELLRTALRANVAPPPSVEALKTYQLNAADPIFRSLAKDYTEFPEWFRKARKDHRPAWVIKGEGNHYAAVLIVKDEHDSTYELFGRVLKVSTFKVADESRGQKYGELLLKTLFAYAHNQKFDHLYVTVFPRHEALLELFKNFGFFTVDDRNSRGETVLAKRLTPTSDGEGPLERHIRFGPPFIDATSEVFVVPIIPRWHRMLFPEAEAALPVWTSDQPYSNALRKAYISGSPNRSVAPGSTLLFYRSKDERSVSAIGVAEEVLVTRSPEMVARFVGRRTVYGFAEISAMAAAYRELHVMLFRQDRILERPWTLRKLNREGVLRTWPQSITHVGKEGSTWVHNALNDSL